MKFPHRIENQYSFTDDVNTVTYDASFEKLNYDDGRITGNFTLGIDVVPNIDPNLSGVSKVLAKIVSGVKSRCVYVGNPADSKPLTIIEGGRISPDYRHAAMKELEARGVKFSPTLIGMAFDPLEDRLVELLCFSED